MGAAMFLWKCADTTPHPSSNDDKIERYLEKIWKGKFSHWPEGYLKLGSGYFLTEKWKYCFLLLIRNSSFYFFDPMFENVTKTHGSRSALADKPSPSAHTLLCDALLLWQPSWITQFCSYTGPSFLLPNTFFQLDLRWYADILRHVSMEHKFRPWQPSWVAQWRPTSNLFSVFQDLT